MQFYGEDINKKFQSLDPVNNPSSASKQTYYVLVDRPVRILFDLRKPRIFGNMWDLGGSRIILKGKSASAVGLSLPVDSSSHRIQRKAYGERNNPQRHPSEYVPRQ